MSTPESALELLCERFPKCFARYPPQATAAGCAIYEKTNLYGNRILELPFDAPIKRGPTESPSVFQYWKRGAREK